MMAQPEPPAWLGGQLRGAALLRLALIAVMFAADALFIAMTVNILSSVSARWLTADRYWSLLFVGAVSVLGAVVLLVVAVATVSLLGVGRGRGSVASATAFATAGQWLAIGRLMVLMAGAVLLGTLFGMQSGDLLMVFFGGYLALAAVGLAVWTGKDVRRMLASRP